MDTIAIMEKLKKKRPDLANDPLFAELEAAQMGEEDMGAMPEDMSYLDEAPAEAGGAPMDEGADALMAELDAAEGLDTEADALMDEEAPSDTSYLDNLDEEEELLEGEEIPAPVKKKKPSATPRFRQAPS